jgi:hypothetical protein
MIKVSRFAVIALIASMAACSSGSPGDPLHPSEANDLCRRFCEHEAACGGGDEQCFDGCVAILAPYLRGDTFTAQYECLIDLDCGADPSACDAFATAQPLDFHLALGDSCREHLDCVTEGFCGNLVQDLRNFNSDVIEDFSACFDLSFCMDIEECLQTTASSIPLLGLF